MCCIITMLMRKAMCAVAIVCTVAELILTVAYHFPFAWIVDEQWFKAFGGLWAYCYAGKSGNALGLETSEECKSIDSSDIADRLNHDFGKYATCRSFIIIAEILLAANIAVLYVACVCFASRVVAIISVAVAVAQAILITIAQPIQSTMFDKVTIVGTEYNTDTYFMGYILWITMVGSWIVAGLSVAVLLFIIYETKD